MHHARSPAQPSSRRRAPHLVVIALLALSAVPSRAEPADDEVPLPTLVEEPSVVADAPARVDDAGDDDDAAEVLSDEPETLDQGSDEASVTLDDTPPEPLLPEGEATPRVDDQATPVTDPSGARALVEPAPKTLDVAPRVVDKDPPRPPPVLLPSYRPTPPPRRSFSLGGAAGPFFEPALGLGALARFSLALVDTELGRVVIDGRALATRTLHQDHALSVTLDEPLALPVFATLEAGFFATNALPYCGDEVGYRCRAADAFLALVPRGLSGDELTVAISRYHSERVLAPRAALDLGAHLVDGLVDVDVALGYSGELIVDGEVGDLDGDRMPDLAPFAHSLRASEPDRDERVVSHGPRARLSVRALDDEAAVGGRGFALTIAPYATSRLLGATYDLAAVAGSLRASLPLGKRTGFALASRTLFDVGVGDAHPLDRARFHVEERPLGFGGIDVGRGVRLARRRGLVKIAEQAELRYDRVIDSLFDLPVRVGAVGFVDVGYVASDLAAVAPDPRLLSVGAGVGARAGLGPLFFRGDLAFSPDEGFLPFPYLSLAHAF